MAYSRLTQEDRIALSVLHRTGHSVRFIAGELGKHHSTIIRELRRNRQSNKSGYHAASARVRAERCARQRHEGRRKIAHTPWLAGYVVRMIRRYWSPEQIAGRLKKLYGHTVVCHETIYRYIYNERPDLKQYLRCKTQYRRRHGSNKRKRARELEKEKRRIDKRPQIVEQRKRIGDWEGDTIVGRERTERILTHVERKTGFVTADKVAATAESVREAAVRRLKQRTTYTVTYDNGSEFADYELIERGIEAKVYFCLPYHSWERGCCENANGLLRQFFPKKTAFSGVSQADLDRACALLNNRPRKRLGYLTPSEALKQERCIGS